MTTNRAPQLLLKDLELLQNSQGQLGFAASGGLALADGEMMAGQPVFQIGVGVLPALPARLLVAFPSLSAPAEPDELQFWAVTTDPQPSDPAWFLAFSQGQIDLFGMQSLADSDLAFPEANFSRLELKVSLQVRRGAIENVLFQVTGKMRHSSSLSGVDLSGIDLDFDLLLNVANLGELDQLVADPAAILDAAFTGNLRFSASGRRVALGNALRMNDGNLEFSLAVHSEEGQRQLILDELDFSLDVSQLELAGAQVANLAARAHFRPALGRLEMFGSLDVILPGVMSLVLARPVRGAAMQGEFNLLHLDRLGVLETELEIRLDRMELDPAVNLLELSARDFQLAYSNRTDDPNGWELVLSGVACQSWSRLAERLATLGILRLSVMPNLPDLRGALDLTLAQSATQGNLHYRLDILAPGTGCVEGRPEQPFRGALNPLPVRLADAFMELSLDFSGAALADWRVSGSGQFSSLAWLHDLLPVDDLQVEFAAQGSPGETPDLSLAVRGSLPVLELPAFRGNTPIRIFQVDELAIHLGSRLELSGSASLLAGDLVAALGLPADWNKLLNPDPGRSLLDDLEITLQLSLPLDGSSDDVTLAVSLQPSNPPVFELMKSIGMFANGLSQPGQAAGDSIPARAEFFTAAFSGITFLTTFSADQFRIELSLTLACVMFGESFDVTASLRLVDSEPELLLMAGLIDPIRLVIPGISPDAILGQVDLAQIAVDYSLSSSVNTPAPGVPADQIAGLADLETALRDLFGAPGQDSSLVFELRNIGLRVSLADAPSLSGEVRLVQLPGFLDAILPPGGFTFGLGSSIDEIFIKVKGPEIRTAGNAIDPSASTPLFSIPLGNDGQNDRFLHFFFGEFSLYYSWATNAFGFSLDAGVLPEPPDLGNVNFQGTGVFIPVTRTFIRIGATASAPPIPIPEWALSFRDPTPSDAAEDMGLQLYTGMPGAPGLPGTRFMTIYFRENSFSPTYFLMQPGLVLDGGVIIGYHIPEDFNNLDLLIDSLQKRDDSSQFLIQFGLDGAKLILVQPALGLLLNPLAAIPPFVSPMPPFWLSPPQFMFDIFVDRLSMTLRLPHLLFFSLTFSRPLPAFSLQAMLELAALVMTGFKQTIPDHSSLKDVFYIALNMQLELPLLEGLVANRPSLTVSKTVNFVDLLNGLVQLLAFSREALETGADISHKILEDPSILVRMVPVEYRRFELEAGANSAQKVLGIGFSGSLYVLTPSEFEAELTLYHENKRLLPVGLAASRPDGLLPDPAQTSPVVNDPGGVRLQQTRTDRFTFLVDPLKHFNPLDDPNQTYIVQQSASMAAEQTQNLARVRGLERRQRRGLPALVRGIWAELLTISARDPAAMALVLTNRRLPQTAAWLRTTIRRLVPPGASGTISSLPQNAQRAIRDQLAAKIETEVMSSFNSYPGLSGPPQEVAQAIVRRSVSVRQVPRTLIQPLTTTDSTTTDSDGPGTGLPPRQFQFAIIVDQAAKQAAYQELIGAAVLPAVFRQLEACFRAIGGPYNTNQEAAIRIAGIVSCLAGKLENLPGKTTGTLVDGLFVRRADELEQMLRAAIPPGSQTRAVTLTTTVFDGIRTRQLLLDNIAAPPPALPGVLQVTRITGYQIRSREGLNPASEPIFSVPVPVSNPLFAIRRQGGKYRLAVEVGDTNPEIHELPGWLVDGPETPQKIDLVRSRLVVTERSETHPRTPEEAAFADGRPSDSGAHFYQSSILGRPEYQLKGEGGLHGPIYIADLLKTDAGEYILPKGPVLLGGFDAILFDNNSVKLAGLLAGPDSIFLNGFHNFNLSFGNASLHLQGEFHLIAGQLWEAALAGSSLAQAQGLTPNSLSFNGFAELLSGSTARFRGQASGIIAVDGQGRLVLDLNVGIEVHLSWTLSIADSEVVKATLDGKLNLGVEFSAISGGSITTLGQVKVKVYTATPAMVELIPPVTVCSFDGEDCVTLPGVGSVPDFSNTSWGTPVEVDAILSFEIGANVDLAIKIEINGQKFTLVALN